MGVAETRVQREILEAVRKAGYSCWRMPLGGVKHGGVYKRNPLKGFPDLFGILKRRRGVLFCVEVKTVTGRLSKEQLMWAERLATLGVPVIAGQNPSQVLQWLTAVDRANC